MRACRRTRVTSVEIVRPTTSMTAKVTRYCVSETAKSKRGGTKKKSSATTETTAAKMEGPRPCERETATTPSR